MTNKYGIWQGENIDEYHAYDQKLCLELVNMFQEKNICDLGCGLGDYIKEFKEFRIECDGFDGNPDTPEITNSLCRILNLAEDVGDKIDVYDWVLSLEVGENIPKEYEEVYINNLHIHNKEGIVISWAIEGQPGFGHINCQNNDYIKKIFANLGYMNNTDKEQKLREASTLWWFKNTIMVFEKFNDKFGSWITIDMAKDNYSFDESLCEELVNMFKEKSVGDFGCGMGDYLRKFKESEIKCIGYDGNPNTLELTDGLGTTVNLSEDQDLDISDWVLSIEVGDHIPEEYEEAFIKNLHKHNKQGIILSWAIPEREGFGHLNKKDTEYIKRIFECLGYTNNLEKEEQLRNSASSPNLKNTLMIFEK